MIRVVFPASCSLQISLPHMPPSAHAWQVTQGEQDRFPRRARHQGDSRAEENDLGDIAAGSLPLGWLQ